MRRVKHVHYGAAAGAAWHAAGVGGAIRRLVLRAYPEAQTYCGNRAPRTAIQAQFSLTWGLASALLRGGLGPEAYTAAALADEATVSLEALIELERLETEARACEVVVETAEGVWRMRVDSVPGDADRPLDASAVAAKFRRFAGPVIGDGHAGRLIAGFLDGALEGPVALG